MKRGTPDHPKTHELARLLGIQRAHAVGLLEMFWHWVAKFSPRGDVGKWSDTAIATGAGWEDSAPRFIEALAAAGWIDADAQYRYLVHDWQDHADDSVKKAVARGSEGFAEPCRILSGQMATKSAVVATCLDKNRLPEPEPEPVPVPEPVPGRAERGATSAPASESSTAAPLPHRAAVVPITAPPPPPVSPPKPPPKPPALPLPDDEPDRAALAASAVDAMLKQHWVPSNRSTALAAMERILADAVHPASVAARTVETHQQHSSYRQQHPECRRRPQLAYWLADGDYLHGPPATEAAEPEDKVTIAMRMLAERSRERGQKLANG